MTAGNILKQRRKSLCFFYYENLEDEAKVSIKAIGLHAGSK